MVKETETNKYVLDIAISAIKDAVNSKEDLRTIFQEHGVVPIALAVNSVNKFFPDVTINGIRNRIKRKTMRALKVRAHVFIDMSDFIEYITPHGLNFKYKNGN